MNQIFPEQDRALVLKFVLFIGLKNALTLTMYST